MAAEIDTGMELPKMKALLAVSKKQPVSCAVGLTKTGAVLMLDKIKAPKALVKDLQKKFADLKMPNWGTAFVDTDEDPKLVIMTLEKAPGGIGKKLKKTLKGSGFSKVEIRGEDGTVAEKVGEEEEEEGEAAPARPQSAAPADAAAEPAGEAAAPAAEAAAPEPAPPAPELAAEDAAAPTETAAPAAPAAAASPFDAGTLSRQLTDLVKQMIPALTADPSRAASLKALATQAQGSLKSGDLAGADGTIKDLQQALAQPAAPAGPAAAGAAPPNMAALGKAKLAWSAARKKVESEVDKLHSEMTKHYKDHGFGGELDKFFSAKVEPMMDSLDDSLVHKLDEVTSNKDPAAHTKLVGEAKQIIKGYETYLGSEPIIKKLDSNPFVPLAIEKTLTATLEALSRAVV